MTDDRGPSRPTDQAPPRWRRDVVTTIVMVVFGIILLLPGVCSLFFMSAMGGSDGTLVTLWLICFAISAGGIALLVKAAT
jgi:uncharacterized membrane protein YraQ (UPF0718 family)